MESSQIQRLLDEAIEHKYSRRQMLKRIGALSLSVPVVASLLAACGDDDDDDVAPSDPDTDDSDDDTVVDTDDDPTEEPDDTDDTEDVVDDEDDDTDEPADDDSPREGGIFVHSQQEFTTMAPAKAGGHTTFRFLANMYEGLVREDLHDEESTSLETVPWLAESWEISDDGLAYTFSLRQGVEFHDGTPFNADAVMANYERHRDEDSIYYDADANRLTAEIYGAVESGEVIDEFTWQYNLSRPFGEFIRVLESLLMLIISPTALEEHGPDEIEFNPSGTGPFIFVERQPGVRAVVDRNPDYWGGPAYLDRVVAEVFGDAQASAAALMSGDIDLVGELLPDQVNALDADPDIDLRFQPMPHVWFWMFNNQHGPTADKRVRQALNYGWNRDSIVALLDGIVEPAISPVPLSNPVQPTVAPYEYDPERAMALLEEAGYGDGVTLKLMFSEVYGGGGLNTVAMNEQLQADFAEIGVDLELDIMERTAFLDRSREGLHSDEHAALQTNWFTDSDRGYWLELMFHTDRWAPNGNNRGLYSNPEVDELVIEAGRQATLEDAVELYQQALDIIVDDAPWLWVVHSRNPVAVRADVRGLSLSASPYWDLHPVWLDRD